MWLQYYAWTQIKQPVSIKSLYYFEWLLWSYVVELLSLDTNNTGCVDVDLPLDVLVFSAGPKYPIAAEAKSDDCVRYNHACPRYMWVAPLVACG